MSFSITQHASIRMQQRGINASILAYLQEFGSSAHDGHGACVLFFNKKAKSRLRRVLDRKEFARIESKLNVYAVVSGDGLVITAGYKQHRFHH